MTTLRRLFPLVFSVAFLTTVEDREAALGQAPESKPPAAAASTPAVRESKPEVYFVPDKNGELVPLVGFSLAQFERWLRDEQGADAALRKASYRLESVAAVGDADARNVRLQIDYTATVSTADWVRVPLGLRGSVIEKQAQYAGPGKYALEFDAESGEYALWLQGKPDTTHKLSVRSVTAAAHDGAAATMHLQLPRAWSSSLMLTVPEKNATVLLSTGAILEEVKPDKGGSQIRVSGIGGDFSLSWMKADASQRKVAALLETQTDVAAMIDGRSVTYEAQIAVTSFGGEFDRFRIRLPPATVLIEEDWADLVLQKQPAAKGTTSAVYEVRRPAGPTKSIVLRVQALRPLEPAKGQTTVDLGGIEVLEAVRQWGFLGVRVEGDWQVLWGDRTQIRQVESVPEFLRGRNPTAVFEYFGRTFTLNARIVPRETRVTVEPSYSIEVTSRRVFLEARFRYRIGGAKVFTLDADFVDWQIDEVGPPELIDAAAIVVGKGGPVSMPLLQPSTGDFEIVVRGHRDLAADAKTLELSVPRPKAGVVGPAAWTVHAADNVELSPREAAHTGLLRQTRSDGRKYAADRTGWYYTTDATDAKFAADFRVLSRTVRIRSLVTATLGPAGRVEQRFAYTVAREPLDALEFDVPAALTEAGVLEIKLADETLPWVVVDEGTTEPRKPARIRVSLPTARIGTFELVSSVPLAVPRPDSPAGVPVSIPVLVPIDGEVAENELRLVAEPGLKVEYVDPQWMPATVDGATTPPPATISYRSSVPRNEALIGVLWEAEEETAELRIERCWIQSVRLGAVRWERATFRLSTRARSAIVRLPPHAAAVTALVDQTPLDLGRSTTGGTIALAFPAGAQNAAHVVDLRYQVAADGAVGEDPLPHFLGARSVGQVYRQFIFSGETILWQTPPGYAAEFDWTRQGLVWVRRPRLDQAELERWVGVQSETPPPPQANVYLLSTYGEPPPLALRTIRRSVLALAASGTMLAACLLLLYLPALRPPLMWPVLGAAIVALGLTYPETVPLVIQASLGGAALAFTAMLLQRNVDRRLGRVLRNTADAHSAAPRGSTKTRLSTPVASLPSSTAAVELPPASSAASGGAT